VYIPGVRYIIICRWYIAYILYIYLLVYIYYMGRRASKSLLAVVLYIRMRACRAFELVKNSSHSTTTKTFFLICDTVQSARDAVRAKRYCWKINRWRPRRVFVNILRQRCESQQRRCDNAVLCSMDVWCVLGSVQGTFLYYYDISRVLLTSWANNNSRWFDG